MVPPSVLSGEPTSDPSAAAAPPPASREGNGQGNSQGNGQGNSETNEADAIAVAASDADFVVPAPAPTGAPFKLPRYTRRVGEKRRVRYATGGSDNAERDRYEVIETVKGMTGAVVTEVDYEVLSSSMSAFSGHSSLHGGYVVRGGPRNPTTQELRLSYFDRNDTPQQGVTTEELDALAGDQVGQVPPSDNLFATVALRVGEVITLTDDQEKLLVGQAIPSDVFLTRLPDRAGRFVAVMLTTLTDGGMTRKSRVTFEYDLATGFLRRGIQLIATEMKGSDGRVDRTKFVVLNEYEPAK